jgi:hypothetical protein
MSELPSSACWRTEDVAGILRAEALVGGGEVFLATHTSIHGFEVLGERAASIATADEGGLLAALSDPGVTHAFAVVQGEPGSGKSHLIRWLRIRWPVGRDIPLLIQRASSSLEGSLQELRKELPLQYRPLLDRIGLRQKASMAGRIADFLSSLTNTLRPDYYDERPDDYEFCRRYEPAAILGLDAVRSAWPAPGRIVRLLAGAEGGRNSATATFDVYDIETLLAYHPLVQRVSPASAKLLEYISRRELTAIEHCRLAGMNGLEAEQARGTEMPLAAAFAHTLNVRRNRAVQNSLGVSAAELKSVFLDLRRALRQDGRRLVLLLEDITAWEGLDDGLIDVLVTNADTRGDGDPDLCDLISVVGVTPYYYGTIRANYRQRITHEIRLGRADGALQDVASMRDPEDRLDFVARYLSAVRAGPQRLLEWRAALDYDSGLQPPNPCINCEYRSGCHVGFGAVYNIGLFPFTAAAIGNFWEALKARDGDMTWRTPRGIIQAVLSPTLTRGETIAERRYPPPEIEQQTALDPDARLVVSSTNTVLQNRVEAENRDRMRRLVAFWQDRDDGARDAAFAGIPKAVFETFDLPWIGGNVAPPQTSRPEPAHDVDPDPEVDKGDSNTAKPNKHTRSAVVTLTPKQSKPAPKKALPREVEQFLLDIAHFEDKRELRNPSIWNQLAHEMASLVEPRRISTDVYIFRKLFTPELVKVAGTGQVRDYHLVLPTEPWLLKGLQSYAEQRLSDFPGDRAADEVEYVRRCVARCLFRLEHIMRAHVARRMPTLPDGGSWEIVGALAEILLLRAWLRGSASPLDPLDRQWSAVLDDEPLPTTDPQSRVPAWGSLLEKTMQWHSRERLALRQMISMAQGEAGSFGLAHAAPSIKAMIGLGRNFRLEEFPNASALRDPEVDELPRLLDAIADALPRLAQNEDARLRDRLGKIEEGRRDLGLRAHLDRIDGIVAKVSASLPLSAPQQVREWRDALARIDKAAEPDLRQVENAIIDFVDESPGLVRAEILASCARQPAALIQLTYEAFAAGEAVIAELLRHVEDITHAQNSEAAALPRIREVGERLRSVAERVVQSWSAVS